MRVHDVLKKMRKWQKQTLRKVVSPGFHSVHRHQISSDKTKTESEQWVPRWKGVCSSTCSLSSVWCISSHIIPLPPSLCPAGEGAAGTPPDRGSPYLQNNWRTPKNMCWGYHTIIWPGLGLCLCATYTVRVEVNVKERKCYQTRKHDGESSTHISRPI